MRAEIAEASLMRLELIAKSLEASIKELAKVAEKLQPVKSESASPGKTRATIAGEPKGSTDAK